jgi:hypothetical protein
MIKNVTLYRPTGANELALIVDSGMKRLPPRLFWQPIFYPVLNLEYASEITERWNMVDLESDVVGFVTEFDISEDYFKKFQSKLWDSITIRSFGFPLKSWKNSTTKLPIKNVLN